MTIQQHITALQTRLQTISYGGSNIVASKYYITTPPNDKYPYFFITDGKITPNKDGKQLDLGPNGDYLRLYEYDINVAFSVDPQNISATQDKIRDVTELLLAKLQGATMLTRTAGEVSTGLQLWNDLNLTSISAPINGMDIGLEDNCIIRTFTVEIEELVEIPA
jgi:hypothetical protein